MLSKTPVAVFVSGGGTNLQALIDAEGRGQLPHVSLSLVVASKENAYALERANGHGISSLAVQRKDFARQEDYEAHLVALLAEKGIKMVVLAGFLSILGTTFLNGFGGPVLNVHPALIPAFCGKGFYGLKVHQAALDYGVKITGATVHYVNEIPDGGEIIAQKAVAVQPGDTPETLQRRVMEQAEWVLLPQSVELVAKQLQLEGNL